ncbi:xylose isomerase [Jeotgalibaca sp. MA1X17-3]|uniref:xylose isomerase n=1 Tax=Jeotgalibaca sp. MA1X17-3 TaxID=2908211 RepID=UPI001F269178|nr:xylose isomerase [Jeotgalibaca sp. MA1X17-3]UJF15543.1 xylose isomerase [Jeotgalibaca sp. MA1X17-3]
MTYFPTIEKIKFEGKETENPFAFRYYNPEEMVLGKTMKDHLRFSVAYWHTFVNDGADPFGQGVNQRTWLTDDPMKTAKNRVEASFELFEKLGVEYFCFHDMDVAPFGESLEEFFKNLDEIVELIAKKMEETGVKLLWNTADRHSNPVYVNGAASSNNADVFAISAAQVKKGIDISKKLGGENFVFWGGREGYESLINTDMKLEEENIARLYKMVIDYSNEIDHGDLVFLLEPKPKEPMKHQYDFDAATSMAFLQKYDLTDRFKLNLEANHATLAGHTFEHEIQVARNYDALGSLDANQGDMLLGWDTDEFPTDLYSVMLTIYEVLENGGIAPGGINFDAKVRRTSFEMEDLVLAHIAGMDTFARGLKAAAKLKEDRFFEKIKEERYASYQEGIGADILSNQTNLKLLTEYALKQKNVQNKSSHIEYIKSKLNDYLV